MRGLSAQDASTSSDPGSGVDNLFSNPEGDTTTADSGADYRATFESAPKTKVSGDLSGSFGLGLGWTQWPELADPRAGLATSVGFLGTTTASFDARPDSSFHAAGTFSLTYDPRTSGSYVWDFSSIAISELYGDYNLNDSLYLRFGQFGMSWGQGRLFMPGNLVSDASSGFALRLSLPTLLSGLSFVALAQPSFFATASSPSWREIAVGATTDMVFGGLRVGFGGRYQLYSGARGLLSLKTTLFGTDLFADGVASSNGADPTFQTMAGFFREWGDFKVYGEWYWNGSSSMASSWATSTDSLLSSATAGGTPGQSLGLVFALQHILGTGVSGGLQWLHAFVDGSGIVVAGLSDSPWNHVTIKVAVPATYGASEGYYVQNGVDSKKRRIACLVVVTIESGF
ncbi:MAG TPA: hypothetical protein VMV44_13735 [Rectinemataceae bacterium]|nr:hypothetical protein [Rectinemataceae bacterium]